MKLQYQVDVTGMRQLKQAFRSIDEESMRQFQQSSAREKRLADFRKRSARQTQATSKTETRERAREVQRQIREVEKQEKYWARQQTRMQVERVKEHERGLVAQARAARRHDAQRVRDAARTEKALARDAARATRARQQTTTRIMGGASRVASTAGGILSSGLQMLGGAAALGGTFAVGNAARVQMSEAAMASTLANQAGDPSLKKRLLDESQRIKGFTGEETLGAIGGFVTKTGDLEAARAAIQDLANLSLATGTDFSDMGEAAGQAFNVIRSAITDPKAQLEALNEVMSTFAGQGNMGAVEIRDLATEIAGLGAATRKYQGGPVQLLKTVGAMAQATVDRGGASSAAEATTAITRFGADLTKKPAQKALAALGINVFSDSGKTELKDPREIMADILGATKGDLTQIQEILNAESIKALDGFSSLFLDAEKAQKGGGRRALMADFERYMGAAISKGDITARANSRLDDDDMKFKEAMKGFNREVGGKLLPELTRLVPVIAELTPRVVEVVGAMTSLAEWSVENPWSALFAGLGVAVTGVILKELAAAGIGWAITSILTKAGIATAAGTAATVATGAATGTAVVGGGAVAGGVGGGILGGLTLAGVATGAGVLAAGAGGAYGATTSTSAWQSFTATRKR